jgi:hypothetical protein
MVNTGTAKKMAGDLSEEGALKNILDSIREYYEKYAHLHSARFPDSLDVSNPNNWDFKEPTKSNLKGKSGIYIIYEDGETRPIYVGSSTNLYNRITMLLSEDSNGHMNHTLTTKLIRDELASDLESACKF